MSNNSNNSDVRSRIFTSQVYHSRLHPVKHTFQYDVYYFVVDLDELQSGSLDSSFFGYNLYRPVSIWDKDYMGGKNQDKDNNNNSTSTSSSSSPSSTIKSRVLQVYRDHLERQQQHQSGADIDSINQLINSIKRIELVTMPRYMNVSFNPVNFYYCYDELEMVIQIIVEINNTFGETHLYFPQPSIFYNQQSSSLPTSSEQKLKYVFRKAVDGNPYLKYYSQQKDFHVSPFNSLDGAYDFCFSDIKQCFDIRINLLSNLNSNNLTVNNNENIYNNNNNNDNINDSNNNNINKVDYVMMTRLWSTSKKITPLNSWNISKVIVGYPITAFLTLPRIMYQAGKLHWERGLKVYAKPNPPTINTTVYIPPSSFQLQSLNFTLDLLKSFNKGHFIITLPDSEIIIIDNNNNTNNNNENNNIKVNNNDPVPINLLSDISKSIEIHVNNYEFFSKIYLYHYNNIKNDRYSSGISAKALGLAYMVGDFTCSDLSAFISLTCDLTTSLNQSPISDNDNDGNNWGWLASLLNTSNNDTNNSNNNNINSIFKYFLSPSTPYYCGLLYKDEEQGNNNYSGDSKQLENLDLNTYHLNNYNTILNKLISNIYNDNGADNNHNIDTIQSLKRILIIEDSASLEFTNYIKQQKKFNLDIATLTISTTTTTTTPNDNNNVFNNLQDIINQIKEEDGRSEFGYFDGLISIESNRVLEYRWLEENINNLLKNDAIIIIQSIAGPYHPYTASDLKPGRLESLTYSQRFARKRMDFESKYWSLFANFQHDPFKLEKRYVHLMKLLSKGYINGHIYDCHHQSTSSSSSSSTCNIINYLVNMVSYGQSPLELIEMENIGDHYPVVIEVWLKRLTEQHDQLIKDYQSFAMSEGCNLKLNESDIEEVYNSLYFHLSYLISCFKSVWSVTRIILKKKKS